MNKRIQIGSTVFFSEYEDFHSHDTDFAEFIDKPIKYSLIIHVNANKEREDTFYYQNTPKEEFLAVELEHASRKPMVAGTFLVPEAVEYLNFTIDDLKLFETAFNSMDRKHTYEKIIFDAYIENNGFYLTQEQRDEAYEEYKSKRQ